MRKCEICDKEAACFHYCEKHHILVCVEHNSPKEIVEKERLGQEIVPNKEN